MKKLILIYFVLLFSTVYAQTNNDIIVKHTGERLNVKIISVDEKITFTFPNENVTQVIGKNCVKQIIFNSGRIQECSEKIVIKGEDDWEKVIISTDPEDIKGLVRKGEVRASASNTWNFKGKEGIDKKATMKIKKEAASLKGHIILLQDQTKKNQTIYSGASSDKYGTAYGYE
ncbi:MAG: hypothetical protein ACOYOV_02870 [Bacteroidales bacterium]